MKGFLARWGWRLGRAIVSFGLGAPKVPAPPVVAHRARTVWLLSSPVARASLRTSPK